MAYATRAELYVLGLPAAALTGVATADQDLALNAASSFCDSYLRGKYGLPIVAPSYALKLCVCQIAAYRLMIARGFAPESPDDVLKTGHEDALAWLKDCAKGIASPVDYNADSTPSVDEGAPLMTSVEPVW